MARANPIVERIRQHRAELDAKITHARSQLVALETEAMNLDKLMAPALAPAAKPEAKARTKRTTVREHDRHVPAPDPGPTLPSIEETV